jgi:hypothetical protein
MSVSFIKDSPEMVITANNFNWKTTRIFWDAEKNVSNYFNFFDTTIFDVIKLNSSGNT